MLIIRYIATKNIKIGEFWGFGWLVGSRGVVVVL